MGDRSMRLSMRETATRLVFLSFLVTILATAQTDNSLTGDSFAEPHTQADFAEVAADAEVSSRSPRRGNRRIVANVRALKAYCISAFDKAADMKDDQATVRSSLLSTIVVKLGKPNVGKSKKKKNIIVEYAELIGNLKCKYNRGIGKYLLSHIDKAVVARGGVIKVMRRGL